MVLRGVSRRAPVGFLALGEARGDLVVGAHLKRPRAPVWVVYAESHYSVLFALDANVVKMPTNGADAALPSSSSSSRSLFGRPDSQSGGGSSSASSVFDLYYYDELANQDEEIRLTIDASPPADDGGANGAAAGRRRRQGGADDMVSYVDLCVRTVWPRAAVNWNGVAPLL